MLPGTNHIRRQFTPIAGIFAEQMARNAFFLDTYRWAQWSEASFLLKCEEQNSATKKKEQNSFAHRADPERKYNVPTEQNPAPTWVFPPHPVLP